jgi:peptidoglycan/LPS O-acetylase OafA/YrhL
MPEVRDSSNVRRSSLGGGGGWYPGLDGVRGVAVFLVFTIHYVPKLTGYIGWMGVLIFFVLSGFLITGVLYDNRDEPRRFRNFYIRRTLRIFPLFYFIWICIFITGIFFQERWRPVLVLWPVYLGNYARFFAGSPTVDRIWTSRFAFEIGHFWSLAVEEQFYLLWPLVVFKVKSRRPLIRICLSVMIAVLLLRIFLSLTVPASVLNMEFLYRMTFSQVDAFLFGGLLALLMRGRKESALLRLAPKLFAGASVALIVAWLVNSRFQFAHLSPSTLWVGQYGFTLIDLASGGLILASLQPGNPLFPLMNFAPLRLLGRYSYGFYVYHVLIYQPLVGFVLNRWRVPLAILYTVDFFIILGVSALSYHLLEMPFLRLKKHFATRHARLEDVPQGRSE